MKRLLLQPALYQRKNKSKIVGKICLNTFSQVEEVLVLRHRFFKTLATAYPLNSVTFFCFKIDYTQSDESWLIYGVSLFLGATNKKGKNMLKTSGTLGDDGHFQRVKKKWVYTQDRFRSLGMPTLFFFKNVQKAFFVFKFFC